MNTVVKPEKPKIKDIAPSFWELCRNATLQRFVHVSSKANAKIVELSDWDAMSYGSNMSVILVAGKDFKFFFKVHFFPKKTARYFIQGASKSQVLDFYREFCNLVAGAIKQSLLDQGVVCGISLPTIISGYDEMIFSDKVRPDRSQDVFQVAVDDFRFTVTCGADITSAKVLEAVKGCQVVVKDSEEIEFL